MKRRNFLSGAALGATAATSMMTSARANERRKRRTTFVFVHGAWHGSWCWSEVVRLLSAEGHDAIALDLPGHGVTAHLPQSYLQKPQNLAAQEVSPLAVLTLNDYRDSVLVALRGMFERNGERVVLVGHSLGGATLCAVGERNPI